MTSKERMTIAMRGGIPDRVPVMPQITVPHAIRVLRPAHYEQSMVQAIEDPAFAIRLIEEVVAFYDADGMRVPLPAGPGPRRILKTDGDYAVWDDASGERIGILDMMTGNLVPDRPGYVGSIEEAKQIPIPTVEELVDSYPFQFNRLACACNTRSIMMAGIVGPITMNFLLAKRGNEQGLTDLVEHPDLVHCVMDKGTRIAINRAKALIETGSDALYTGDAASSCSLISPRHFREYCLPYYQRFVEALGPLGKPIYLHICGQVRPIIDAMVETGSDCIEPLDPLGGMTVAEFRTRAGPRVALMGGVNTLTLAGGTVEDVRREARECIQAGGHNGGYILAAGDMVPNEAPAANVAELCRTARRAFYNPLLSFDHLHRVPWDPEY